jgi:3',5'-nucleoside bisphosphate phosphatase
MPLRADLHSHTLASDGTLDPEALVALAARRDVDVLAVTDHDTLAALPEATAAGDRHGLRVVAGVEISCLEGDREVHVLGLFVDPADPGLQDLLARSRAAREKASERVLERLAAVGAPVSREEVRRFATGDTLGRPHFARALVAKGHVASMAQAFKKYLGEGRPAHVFRPRPSVAEACAAIHGAGGVASLAHPGGKPGLLAQPAIEAMVESGLDALEVHHPAHDAKTRTRLLAWAARLGLGISGGSDYHGTGEGAEPGVCFVDETAFLALEARRPAPAA